MCRYCVTAAIFKPNLVQRHYPLKAYNILAIPSLLFGSEFWTLKQRDIRELKVAEMGLMRHSAG
jgi:hypothetical protein